MDEYRDERLIAELGTAICQSLGLDPARTLRVTIEWEPHRLPRAIATVLLTEGTVRELINLTPRDREVVP